jgi:hypothetical protein
VDFQPTWFLQFLLLFASFNCWQFRYYEKRYNNNKTYHNLITFLIIVRRRKPEMPIKGNYTWTEKKDSLKIAIPLKGVSPNKVDIFGKFCFHTPCAIVHIKSIIY